MWKSAWLSFFGWVARPGPDSPECWRSHSGMSFTLSRYIETREGRLLGHSPAAVGLIPVDKWPYVKASKRHLTWHAYPQAYHFSVGHRGTASNVICVPIPMYSSANHKRSNKFRLNIQAWIRKCKAHPTVWLGPCMHLGCDQWFRLSIVSHPFAKDIPGTSYSFPSLKLTKDSSLCPQISKGYDVTRLHFRGLWPAETISSVYL